MPTDIQAEFNKLYIRLFAKDGDNERPMIGGLLGERVASTDTRAMVVAAYRLGRQDAGKSQPQSEIPQESTPAGNAVVMVAPVEPEKAKRNKRK